jgi:hypothetical protein
MLCNIPSNYFISFCSMTNHKRTISGLDKWLSVRSGWIDNNRTGFCRHYSSPSKDFSMLLIDHFYLDFDSDDNPDFAVNEARTVMNGLSKFNVRMRLVSTGGRGAHLLVFFPSPELIDPNSLNLLHAFFWDYINFNYGPDSLCGSCRKPAKGIVRVIGTYHHSGNQCKVIDSIDNNTGKDLLSNIKNGCIERIRQDAIVSANKKSKKSPSGDVWDFREDFDCRELFADLYPGNVFDKDGDKWRVICPYHIRTPRPNGKLSPHNGVVSSTGFYCSSCGTFGSYQLAFNHFKDKRKTMEYLSDKR